MNMEKEIKKSMCGERIKKGICPRCRGTGFSRAFNRKSRYSEKIRKRAKSLVEQGLTLRVIAKKLNINHPQTIRNILRV